MNRGADIWNSSVRSFPLVRICRIRSGSWNGRPLRKRSLINEKMAVFSPIPSVSVITARKVNPGDLINWRSANRRSVIIRNVLSVVTGPQSWDVATRALDQLKNDAASAASEQLWPLAEKANE